jgi:hypothetical protein
MGWAAARAWLILAAVVGGLLLGTIGTLRLPKWEQAWDGQGEETSYAFTLDGGDYAVALTASCAVVVDLYSVADGWDQTLDGPGVVRIPEGEWFWAVTGGCPWRITLSPT